MGIAIAIYARKSVERENSISCETQVEYCRASIRPEERDETVLTFADNGFSGGNVDRDGFQRMMQAVRQGEIRKVVVYRLDRISRSLADFVGILHTFKEYRVEFVSSQESFDTSSPYGEMIVKILMVFAEFERTSIIDRVTQAYEHRSDLGLYMGGRQPYGFELVPAVIHNIKTKKLRPIPAEIEQILYIFETYAREGVTLRRLQDTLLAEGRSPLNGSRWTTAKLSAILKNPIYVKADASIYDYYEGCGTRMITDSARFTGEFGAQLYGRRKQEEGEGDRPAGKLVLMSHRGIVDSDIWLRCQRKLQKNRRITTSYTNPTSWLAGQVVCCQCGHTMTTVKGKPDRSGEVRRYFNCTGKSHKKICKGPGVTIYAEDLERMVCSCIGEKLSRLKNVRKKRGKGPCPAINDLKIRLKEVEKSERRLTDSLLTGGFNRDLLTLANREASRLRGEKQRLQKRLEELGRAEEGAEPGMDPVKLWRESDYAGRKAVAGLMIHKIRIREEGSVEITWRI